MSLSSRELSEITATLRYATLAPVGASTWKSVRTSECSKNTRRGPEKETGTDEDELTLRPKVCNSDAGFERVDYFIPYLLIANLDK